MENRRIKCLICGKEFEPKAANAKYCCTACRQKGKYQRRKEWEKSSSYLEKQRQKMQEYRDKEAADKKAAQEAENKRKAANIKRQTTRRRNDERAKLLQAAEQGDIHARMILAVEESGNTSAEYWEAFKACELEHAAEWGKESTTTVNGISVQSPDFGLAVSISIEELGRIETHAGTTERILDDEGNIL